MMGKAMVGVLAVCLCATGATRIRARDARRLIDVALSAKGLGAKDVVLVPYVSQTAPIYFSFEALSRYSKENGHVGFYAVNPWNGDVWNIDTCVRISSPILRKERESILRHSGIAAEQAAAQHEGPPCRVDDGRPD